MNPLRLATARDLLDDVLDAAGVSLVMAAPGDLLSRRGFDAAVRDLVRDAKRALAPTQRAAVRRAQAMVERDWAGLSEVERDLAATEIARELGAALAPGADDAGAVLSDAWGRIASTARVASIERHELRPKARPALPLAFASGRRPPGYGQEEPVYEGIDPRVLDYVRRSSRFYVRDGLGRAVGDPLARDIRETVARGIGDGFDNRTIGKDLATLLEGQTAKRAEGYFVMAASVATARARSYGVLLSFEESLIQTTRFVAVLDEVTSQVCRFMHGRTFEVRQQLERYAQVAAAPEPEDVKRLQPFMRTGKDQDGNPSVGVRDPGSGLFVPFATVQRSGLGRKDDPGAFTPRLSPERMLAFGCCTPPLHPHCRSLLVPGPVRSVQVPSSAPVGPPATPGAGRPAQAAEAGGGAASVAMPWAARPAEPDEERIETVHVRPAERVPPERPRLLDTVTPPNDRHFINRIRAGSRVGAENTVVLGSVVHHVSQDHRRILAGEGQMVWEGDTPGVEIDGRVYGWHSREGGSLYPLRGSGFVNLTKPEFVALRIIATAVRKGSSPEAAASHALKASNVTEADVAEALRVYRLRKVPR